MTKTMDRTVTLGEYRFNEGKHLHELLKDGKYKPLTGVTTVLKVIGKGDVLVNWAANCAVDYLGAWLGETNATTRDELMKEWLVVEKEARKAHTKKKESAGTWGTQVHTFVEQWINAKIAGMDGVVTGKFTEDSEEYKTISQFIKWAQDNNVKFLASEKHVYSKEMWVGGICDIICEIDGKRYVGDIKTSKGIYPEAFIQCSAYAKMLGEMQGDKFDGVVIINLKKDGGFDVQYNYDLEGNFKCFESALQIYRHMQAITK